MINKLKQYISELRDPKNQDSVFVAYLCSTVAYCMAVVPLVGK